MEINEDIAEMIGIILGDGHLHTIYNLITIVGSLEDKQYYQKQVIKLFSDQFNNFQINLTKNPL